VESNFPISSMIGRHLWSVVVKWGTRNIHVYAYQEVVQLASSDTVVLLGEKYRFREEDQGEQQLQEVALRHLNSRGRRVEGTVKRLILARDISPYVKEADVLEFPGIQGLQLRVSAVRGYRCICQVLCRSPHRVEPGATIRHKEYKSDRESLLLIGLLAMIRWRLLELDRRGEQVVTPRQLLDMCVTCMMVRPDRSLRVPRHYLMTYMSERHEKIEAKRLMAQRCARGETTELHRLKVTAMLLEPVDRILEQYGFPDDDGRFNHAPPPLGAPSAMQRAGKSVTDMHRVVSAARSTLERRQRSATSSLSDANASRPNGGAETNVASVDLAAFDRLNYNLEVVNRRIESLARNVRDMQQTQGRLLDMVERRQRGVSSPAQRAADDDDSFWKSIAGGLE